MTTTLFLEMLQFKRPAFSVFEEAFIDRYLRPIPGIEQDAYGNLMIDVGDKPNILWSSHTDTVHSNSGLQQVVVDKRGIVRVADPKTSNCLGADCTTGVYIMIEMIKAGVKGRYVFHREEESGRHGSIYIATKTPDVLKGIDAAIAFDRKGKKDVITHQSFRTSSDEFAESFAAIINMNYKPSPNGSFTDTRSYMELVPECTNISVGYEGAHTAAESQDLNHLMDLVEKMKTFDSSSLVIKRTPGKPDYRSYGNYGGYGGGWQDPKDMWDLVRMSPKSVSVLLEMMGWDFDSLKNAIDLIQAKREDELNIWDDAVDTDGNKLPKGLIAPPVKKVGNGSTH